jgi:hypothetical protein
MKEIMSYGNINKSTVYDVVRKFELSRTCTSNTGPVLLNVYWAPALIPRNEFRQPM